MEEWLPWRSSLATQHHAALSERKRRIRPETPDSLKRKCLEAVLEHREILLEAADRGDVNPFNKLSDSLKKDLLEVVMVPLPDKQRPEDVDIDDGQVHDAHQLQLLHLLLNQEVDDVAISLEAYSASFKQFWALVERVRPKLKTLDVRKRRVAYFYGDLLPPQLDILVQFQQLKELSVNQLGFSDYQLQQIAAHLPQLEVLRLLLVFDTSCSGISSLSQLQKLREFHIETRRHEYSRRFFALCLQLLPGLQVNSGHIDLTARLWEPQLDKLCADEALGGVAAGCSLGLQQLVLEEPAALAAGLQLPNLRSLLLLRPTAAYQRDERFCSITELSLVFLGMNFCVPALEHLGGRLLRLAVGGSPDTLRPDVLLRLCPRLQHFCIGRKPRRMRLDGCSLLLPQLLSLDLWLDGEEGMAAPPPQLLLQLLQATPQLQQLRLRQVPLGRTEVNELVKVVRQGGILQQLQRFEFYHTLMMMPDVRRCYDFLVKHFVQSCPQLVHLEHPPEKF